MEPPVTTARATLTLALLVVCGLHNAHCGGSGQAVPTAFKAVDAEMEKLADAKLFAGFVHVVKGGRKVVFSKGYGLMFPEWNIPIPRDPSDVRYHAGSVMRLLVATLVWQQQALGVLSVTDPISKHLQASDFNITTWCPRLYNDTTGQLQGDCTFPTIQDLLYHRSGFVDTGVHCRFPAGSWQADWCYGGPKGSAFPLSVASGFALGVYSPLAALIALEHPKVPLQALPRTRFEDMTVDDTYVAAILEKLTGRTLSQLLQEGILEPAKMTRTFYDLSVGNDGIYREHLPLPGYNAVVSPASVSLFNVDFPYVGADTLRGGDCNDSDRDPEGPPYGTFVKMARNNQGIDGAWVGLAGAAGALVTTPTDMARFMTTLTRKPKVLGLDLATVKRMFTTGYQDGPLFFAQGILTKPSSSPAEERLGTPWAYYTGNMGYSAQQYTEWPQPDRPGEDITATFVGYTKPMVDLFEWKLENSTDTGSFTTGGDDAAAYDPTQPSDGRTTCYMRLPYYHPDSSIFAPAFGVAGSMPTYSATAFQQFYAALKAQPDSVANQWVPCPHIYCDAWGGKALVKGLDYHYLGRVVSAALGHPWFDLSS